MLILLDGEEGIFALESKNTQEPQISGEKLWNFEIA